jgi:hypothetical protein
MTMLEAALGYATLGYAVFPLHGVHCMAEKGVWVCRCRLGADCKDTGKHPQPKLAPHGFKSASRDPTTIKRWWGGGGSFNIGVATGDIVVVDIDPRHGGGQSLAALLAKHGALPPTWEALSGGGGSHYYFKPPTGVAIRCSEGKIAPGVDVKGAGGYIVGVPSLHVSGKYYSWLMGHKPSDLPIAAMPDWLVMAAVAAGGLSETKAARPATYWRELVRKPLIEGKRNSTIMSLSGHLLRRYVDAEVVLVLMQSFNQTYSTPPLGADEVTRIVNSAAGREFIRRNRDGW